MLDAEERQLARGTATSCLINSWQLGPLQDQLIELTGWAPPWDTWHGALCWEGDGLLCSLIPSAPPTHCPSKSLPSPSSASADLSQALAFLDCHQNVISSSRSPWPSSSLWPGGAALTQEPCCNCKVLDPLSNIRNSHPTPCLPTPRSPGCSWLIQPHPFETSLPPPQLIPMHSSRLSES